MLRERLVLPRWLEKLPSREGGRKNSSNFKKAKRVKTEDEKEKDPEEKKEVTEEEKTKEEKPEAKGVKEEVKLA